MAKRFYIYRDLEVLEFDAVNEWGYPRHKHHFFELTFVLKGSGYHVINESTIEYREGDLFFLTPKDEHEFVVDEASRFGIIKFTEQLFLEKASMTSGSYWRRNLETVIFHSNTLAESILHFEKDGATLFRLYALIRDEWQQGMTYNREVLMELFGALLVVLSRNLKHRIKVTDRVKVSDKERVNAILSHVRHHVLDKERIRIKTIAEEFSMSPNYVGIYIKKHLGISLQHYIMRYRLKMAEQLLRQSQLNISQIANKLGFVDAGHFHKTFKKYIGVNPGEFK
jgi:YesN/AraC family two-component response regulator